MTALDPQSYRAFFGQLPTGVTAIVANTPDGTVGLVVGTFSSVSLDPPLVSFMVTSGSRSWAAVKAAGRFTANILASDQRTLSQTLSGWSPDKFRSVKFDDEQAGIIGGCLAWANCTVDREIEAGDHIIVLATPCELTVARASRPLIFFQRAYHRTLPVEDFRAPGWS
jgi:3-hydroxy-9,10-secoandrosta-1,3,5(10)-triene-9,17-dione monooxygenase reductase component